jgi:hypothetical protein
VSVSALKRTTAAYQAPAAKRGFTNVFKLEFNVVNVGSLNVFPAGAEVSPKG